MDFLSNLIKRPNSIATMSVPEENSPKTETTATTALPQLGLTMDRCTIDTELEQLFESAGAEDLKNSEEQGDRVRQEKKNTPSTPTSPRETIKQLLSEINVNLDKVTAHEMEHLQAMSLELSPLAVKASPRHSMEQQKALVAAMRSTSQPGTPTVPSALGTDPFKNLQDVDAPGMLKFKGLPEFDETQIPELATLSADMPDELKADTAKSNDRDRDYNSDSDVYAECLSLNSVKMSGEPSELEAYSSALNEILEHQLSNVTATTLENTLSEPSTATSTHNDSCEPMEVDEISETINILKDVLAPEEHQMLQEQFLSVAMQEQLVQETSRKEQQHQQKEETKQLLKLDSEREQMGDKENQLLDKEASSFEASEKPEQLQIQLATELTEEKLQQPQLDKEHQEKPEKLQQQLGKDQEEKLQQPQLDKEQQEKNEQRQLKLDTEQKEENLQQPQVDKEQQEKLKQLQSQSDKEQQENFEQAQAQSNKEQHEENLQQQLEKQQQEEVQVHSEKMENEEQLQREEQQDKNQQQQQENSAISDQQLPREDSKELLADQPKVESMPQLAEIPEESSTQSIKPPIPKYEPFSPPIPTHRKKTPEELEVIMALQQFEQVQQEEVAPAEKQEQLQLKMENEFIEKSNDLKPLQLNMIDSSQGDSSAPNSPVFPIKLSPEKFAHFPRSPRAPVEQEEMPYLEQAIIEPSADHKLNLSGVIAKSPLPIQLTVTQPSPEEAHKEQERERELNATMPMGNSPLSSLNGTFDNAHMEITANNSTAASRRTFGVPLTEDNAQGRRTFSVNGTAEQRLDATVSINGESTLNDTYAMPLTAVNTDQRRTFVMPEQQIQEQQIQEQQIQEQQIQEQHLTALMGQPRRTFCMEPNTSPAMEATEENIVMEDNFEPMDVDQSMRVVETTAVSMPLSPPLPTHQPRERQWETNSPPLPTHQSRVTNSPPLPAQQSRGLPRGPSSPPLPTHQPRELERDTQPPFQPTRQLRLSPPLPAQLKRPSIHVAPTICSSSSLHPLPSSCPNATVVLEEQTLSAKEQLSVGDEKDDVFVEHFGAMSPITDDVFKAPQHSSSSFSKLAKDKTMETMLKAADMEKEDTFYDAEFQDGASNNNIILNSSDFDYLYTKGSNNEPIDRSSLLLRFDPLLGAPVPVNQSQQQQQRQQQQELTLLNLLSINNNNNNPTRALSPTLEEHETSGSNQSFVLEPSAKVGTGSSGAGASAGAGTGTESVPAVTQRDTKYKPPVDRTKKHAKMSVDVIDNDCNKTFDNSNLNSEDKTQKYHNMDELEKKIKNEVTRSEDIEKKLKEAEQREEALVKRITEKDKTNTKLNGVIEAYEKAIAELIHDKEQLVQNHERQMQDVQADRDSNYHHLTSLETTFSDLHVKYEKSKEMTSHLKQDEENLLEEKKKLLEKLRQQEQRYEQMKSHAMQQMEMANKKLATLTKEHTDEVKKLKALLKKEEVSRISTAEQLQQKSRENADLLKICEELIYDKGQGGSS